MDHLVFPCFCENEKPMFSLAGTSESAGEGGKSADFRANLMMQSKRRRTREFENECAKGALLGSESLLFRNLAAQCRKVSGPLCCNGEIRLFAQTASKLSCCI